MSKYRKLPVVVEATRWRKNGDHPQDGTETFTGSDGLPFQGEGKVVRYYRTPDRDRQTPCSHCGDIMHNHGWIDTLEGGHIVCPGDYVITGVKGEVYPCKADIFRATYEIAKGEDPELDQRIADANVRVEDLFEQVRQLRLLQREASVAEWDAQADWHDGAAAVVRAAKGYYGTVERAYDNVVAADWDTLSSTRQSFREIVESHTETARRRCNSIIAGLELQTQLDETTREVFVCLETVEMPAEPSASASRVTANGASAKNIQEEAANGVTS